MTLHNATKIATDLLHIREVQMRLWGSEYAEKIHPTRLEFRSSLNARHEFERLLMLLPGLMATGDLERAMAWVSAGLDEIERVPEYREPVIQ